MLQLVALLLAFASAQDQPAPSQFIGTWKGTVSQSFAQVNPDDPAALQCLPSTQAPSSSPSTLTIGANGFTFTISPHDGQTTTAGANTYIFPPSAGLSGTFAVSQQGTRVHVSAAPPPSLPKPPPPPPLPTHTPFTLTELRGHYSLHKGGEQSGVHKHCPLWQRALYSPSGGVWVLSG